MWIQPAALLILGVILTLVLGPLDLQGLFGNLSFTMVYAFFGRVTEFFVGAYVAISVQRSATNPVWISRTYLGLIWMAIAFLALAVMRLHGVTFAQPAGMVLNSLILLIGPALFLHGLATESTWASRLLSTRVMEWVGKESYAFYLINMGVLADLVHQTTEQKVLLTFLALNVLSRFSFTLQ